MIFVTVGNHNQPFPRLLAWVSEIARQGKFTEPFFVQAGHNSLQIEGCEVVDFLDSGEFQRRLDQASALVTHAGQGTIFAGLAAGLTPVVVPRLRKFNEHTNDHQLQVASALEKRRLVCIAQTQDELILHLYTALKAKRGPKRELRPSGQLLSIVQKYLDEIAAERARR